jgi:hypothetical protein
MIRAVQESPVGVLEGIAGDMNGVSALALIPDHSGRALVGAPPATPGFFVARLEAITTVCKNLIAACSEPLDEGTGSVEGLALVRTI